MDIRPNRIKRADLAFKCHELVTEDRITFWGSTKIRMGLLKLSMTSLLKLGFAKAKS